MRQTCRLARVTDEILLAVLLNVPRADISIILIDRVGDVSERQVQRHHPIRTRSDVVLLLKPSNTVHFNYARNSFNPRLNAPILNLPPITQLIVRPLWFPPLP